MGVCGSSHAKSKRPAIAGADTRRPKNVLLLGTHQSGRSTLCKQMKILYDANSDYTTWKRDKFANFIYLNIIEDVQTVLRHSRIVSPLTDLALQDDIDNFLARRTRMSYNLHSPPPCAIDFDEATGDLIAKFWGDPGFQKAWMDRSKLQVQDSLAYFCSEIGRISKPGYSPNDEDILRVHMYERGNIYTDLTIDGVKLIFCELDGKLSRRRKWIYDFKNASVVLFIAAMSEYDQDLLETSGCNRLDAAVELFHEMCMTPYLQNIPVILFLNKEDLLREKLQRVPFPVGALKHSKIEDFAYDGALPPDFPDAASFERYYQAVQNHILQLFLKVEQDSCRQISHHVVCATDSSSVEAALESCMDIILGRDLEQVGLQS